MTITNQSIFDTCLSAHNNFVRWYNNVDSLGEALHLNEHLFSSFLLNEFVRFNPLLYGTFETNREIVEIGLRCDRQNDRNISKESGRHRFDLTLWKDFSPKIVLEAKGNIQSRPFKDDIEKLWYIVRRAAVVPNFLGVFAISIWELEGHEEQKSRFEAIVAELKTEGYLLMKRILPGETVKCSGQKTSCGTVIIRAEHIVGEYRL